MRRPSDAVRVPAALGAALLALALAAPGAEAFPKPRLGLEAMLSGSQSWYPELPYGGSPYLEFQIAGGYAVGGTAAWRLTGPLKFETGLRYSLDTEQQEFSYPWLGGGYESVSRVRLHRLGIPVRLRVAVPSLRGLSVEGTAETQYLLQARRDDERNGNFGIMLGRAPEGERVARPGAIIFEQYTGQEDITGMYARWNLALGGGLAWEFPLGRTTGEVRARYQQGVSDQTLTPYAKDFSRVAELGLAVRW
jgi:hypothetical protein